METNRIVRAALASVLVGTALVVQAASPPSATTLAPTNITTTGARLNGTVTPNDAKTTVAFDFGTTTSYGSSPAASPSFVGRYRGPTAVTAIVSGLACGTTYHYRVRASNRKGNTLGADHVLNTAPCAPPPTPVAPTASTGAAGAIAATGAALNGSASAGSASATASFEYGTTTAYGSSIAAVPASLAANGPNTAVSAAVSGLACATTYNFRVRAVSSVGPALGTNRTFATAACAPTPVAPTATTGAAGAIAATGATLNGSGSAGSASATVSVEYGTTTAYGSNIAAVPSSLAASGSNTAVSAAVSGLACATTYNFRVRAVSSVGTALGTNRTFATASCASPPPPPSTACSSTTVHCVDVVAGANQEFSTIQAAVNVAVAGDVVLVFDGNYVGFVVSRSGTATAPITVKAQGSAAVVDRTNSVGEGIRVNNANYVVIEGFTVVGMPAFGLTARGATATAPMHGIVFRDNIVRNSGSVNIYASQVTDSLIEGNIASGSVASHGFYLANAGADNTTVRSNLSHDNASNGIHLNGDASVGGDGLISGALIEDNIFYGNAANAVNLDGVQSSTFRNNLIYANGRHGIRAYRIDASAGPRDLTIVNNTIVVAASGGGSGIKLSEDQGGHVIFNNVIANEGSGGSIIVGHATFTSDYNMFVNEAFSLNGGASMLSLTQWRAQAGAYDTSSLVSTQPALFVSPTTRDYRLRAGSPAIDAGAAAFNGRSAPASDIAGIARPRGLGHDQGAFESF